MCSSRNASGCSVSRRLPIGPDSSARNATTASCASASRSAASTAATTPSAPSNLPPSGTVSRCDPDQTAGLAAAAEQVAGLISRDLQPRLAHPPRRELVGGVLLGRVREARAPPMA